ncbi:MlaD family protein [Flavihumibacter sp. ZG627]|uniref:MlaD family protein n=1 Tax=Flavihumibacter sp. ZG627 TaxID=1463156 RepID=UPI00057E887A|nr:MlaD family protein [Flavihumibacter sp. ZG627]KIC91371.1 hypothetical protein HY58_03730 [Flavihumibacter sp. ZG627]
MKISTEQKIKTGTFVAVSLGLLLVLIFLIGKQQNLFGNKINVFADFKNIAGTREGNYVRFAGINIGTVDQIRIINDTTVRLMLTLEKEMQPYIKADAVASIGSDGLMGDKLIMISPGDSATVPVKDGAVIQSVNPMDMDKVMNNISLISENAADLTDGLANIVGRIDDGEGSLGRLLNDDKLAVKLEGAIDQTKQTVGTIKKTASTANETLEAAQGSFLLRGHFKRKERQRIKDSIANAKEQQKEAQKEAEPDNKKKD